MPNHPLDRLRHHLTRDRGVRALDITHIVVSGGAGEAGLNERLAPGDSLRLVLADPRAVADLSAQPAPKGLALLEQAVMAAAPGPQLLHRTSFAPLDGLGAPAPALLALFPGLRLLSRDRVEARDIATLPLPDPIPDPLEGDRALILCLEAPGRTLDLLNRLAASGKLAQIDAVLLRDGRDPLHEGAAPLADVAAMLGAHGFAVIEGADLSDDPDRPWLLAAMPAGQRLRNALAEARAALAAKPSPDAELTSLREALAKAQSERDAAQVAAARALSERDATREALAKAQAERNATQEAFTTAKAERDAAHEAKAKALSERDAARDEGARRLAATRESLWRAEGQIDLLRGLLAPDPARSDAARQPDEGPRP